MKRFYNYTFGTICTFILLVTIYSITNVDIVKERNYANNINNEKVVNSVLLAKSIEEVRNVVKEENVEPVDVIQSTPVPTPASTPKPVEPKSGNTTTTYNPIDTSGYTVISSEVVNISHFGPDCNGCGAGYVATGDYVGSGRLYYKDSTFGSVRIVAADKKYPLGTILRLTHNGNVYIAIVLDRGGGIGDGKKYQIDLLAESEAYSSKLGVMRGATLEVLRMGR